MVRYMIWTVLRCATVAGLLAGPAYGQDPAAKLNQMALGVWADENGDSNIQITPCPSGLCGRVVWLKTPNDASGRPKTDNRNPDVALRTRPLVGLTIIAGLKPDSKSRSLRGRVYNADNGKMYDLYLTPEGPTMKVEGCLLSVLCDTQIWKRVR